MYNSIGCIVAGYNCFRRSSDGIEILTASSAKRNISNLSSIVSVLLFSIRIVFRYSKAIVLLYRNDIELYLIYILSDSVKIDTAGHMWNFTFQKIARYVFSKWFNLLYVYVLIIFKYFFSHTCLVVLILCSEEYNSSTVYAIVSGVFLTIWEGKVLKLFNRLY